MIELTCPIINVEPLIPHSESMVLIDRITDFGDDFLIAESEIRENHILIKNGKLEAFAGIEIMAQGIAAWSGCQDILANRPISLGYLLGTRKLYVHTKEIPISSKLQIQIKMSIQDATGFGVFDAKLIDLTENKIILEGALNVFSPREEK
ncbi:dehydratase [Otariodibacter oris]|uniref:Putative hotdog family 3-hydroxylacyl-ACP dehydratase n=1 Tax=Otariodibacter oris TaxID=1032623 RepID=A0A420XGF0_9PAST|nr:dehydratase [Otariodibacter oris]QGM79976.1 dehydratase [Otariodibacter oris]RKR71799.1 putative hotdog family 3-hydroxylacyl-ACP dehydratase [Otariodibacter oris]